MSNAFANKQMEIKIKWKEKSLATKKDDLESQDGEKTKKKERKKFKLSVEKIKQKMK